MNSMTGYGKCEVVRDGFTVIIEMKSVNNRYLDINCKLPRIFSSAEDSLRKLVSSKLSRGRVDIYAMYTDKRDINRTLTVDYSLATAYVNTANELKNRYNLTDDMTVTQLMRMPDVIRQDSEENDETVNEILLEALEGAINNLNAMRSLEGKALKQDLSERISLIQEYTDFIKSKAGTVEAALKAKLTDRITQALAGVNYDEGRLLTEVTYYSDRSNVDEELSRLYSHCQQFKSIINASGQSGRRLDFLVQELNRESNTICSKSTDIEITDCALKLKSEIEKIREQVQNIE